MRRAWGSGAVPMAFAGRASVAKFVMQQKENGKKGNELDTLITLQLQCKLVVHINLLIPAATYYKWMKTCLYDYTNRMLMKKAQQ